MTCLYVCNVFIIMRFVYLGFLAKDNRHNKTQTDTLLCGYYDDNLKKKRNLNQAKVTKQTTNRSSPGTVSYNLVPLHSPFH